MASTIELLAQFPGLHGAVERRSVKDDVREKLALLIASGNPLLADLVMNLYSHVMDRRRAMARPGAIEANCQDHRAIAGALGGVTMRPWLRLSAVTSPGSTPRRNRSWPRLNGRTEAMRMPDKQAM